MPGKFITGLPPPRLLFLGYQEGQCSLGKDGVILPPLILLKKYLFQPLGSGECEGLRPRVIPPKDI
jgi:hypothetical protein